MKISFTILLVFIFASCKKTSAEFDGVNCAANCYILTGSVMDTPANTALRAVELKFYFYPAVYSPFGSNVRYLGRTTTNANGEYTFQFDGTNYKTGEGHFRMKATKPGYFYDPLNLNEIKVFDLDSSHFNIPFNQDFALYKPANLTVRFRATTVTNFEFLNFGYEYGSSGTGIILNGRRTIDTTITYKTAANIPTYIRWYTLGNGVNISRNDTLMATSGGSLQYQINL